MGGSLLSCVARLLEESESWVWWSTKQGGKVMGGSGSKVGGSGYNLVMSLYSISPLSESVDGGLLWLHQDVATDLQQEWGVRWP